MGLCFLFHATSYVQSNSQPVNGSTLCSFQFCGSRTVYKHQHVEFAESAKHSGTISHTCFMIDKATRCQSTTELQQTMGGLSCLVICDFSSDGVAHQSGSVPEVQQSMMSCDDNIHHYLNRSAIARHACQQADSFSAVQRDTMILILFLLLLDLSPICWPPNPASILYHRLALFGNLCEHTVSSNATCALSACNESSCVDF